MSTNIETMPIGYLKDMYESVRARVGELRKEAEGIVSQAKEIVRTFGSSVIDSDPRLTEYRGNGILIKYQSQIGDLEISLGDQTVLLVTGNTVQKYRAGDWKNIVNEESDRVLQHKEEEERWKLITYINKAYTNWGVGKK